MFKRIKTVCIVVPLYKSFSNLSTDECLSFKQMCNILGKREICLIGPYNLDYKTYIEFANNLGVKCKIINFDNKYFTSSSSYNVLLLSKYFYKKFSDFKYILIYQLDAWVFRDELDDWVEKKFDFIGSPFFDNYDKAQINSDVIPGGNGGFSLRNVQKVLNLFNRFEKLKYFKKYLFNNNRINLFTFNQFIGKRPIRIYFKIKNVYRLEKYLDSGFNENEDIFWSIYCSYYFTDYKVAPFSEALKFSFEANPSLLYELNTFKLPFGAHAWRKYDPLFWSDKMIHE
jgi:hypothetical protein